MKKTLVPFVIFMLLFSTTVFLALAANKPPEKGEQLPVINLPIPKNPEESKADVLNILLAETPARSIVISCRNYQGDIAGISSGLTVSSA